MMCQHDAQQSQILFIIDPIGPSFGVWRNHYTVTSTAERAVLARTKKYCCVLEHLLQHGFCYRTTRSHWPGNAKHSDLRLRKPPRQTRLLVEQNLSLLALQQGTKTSLLPASLNMAPETWE